MNDEILSPDRASSPFAVAIIGGGYAGLASAVELASKGIDVRVFEAGPILGGRARRIAYQNIELDNGAHILLGAYRETLRLMQITGVADEALLRLPLQLSVKDRLYVSTASLPAPLHLLVGLLCARGLTLHDRASAIRFMSALRRSRFRLAGDTTVAVLLANHGQEGSLAQYLWEPLCVAALNTLPQHASAQIFLNVLRDSLAGQKQDSDLLLPRLDLSRLFPEAAAAYVKNHGGNVSMLSPVQRIEAEKDGFTLNLKDRIEKVDAVILAVGPHQAARLLSPLQGMSDALSLIEGFAYEPICTVYLQYAQDIRLPTSMLGLANGLIQWLFDRQALYGQQGLLAAVISASGIHQTYDNDALAVAANEEISKHFPHLSQPIWSKVIVEKFATFACTPNLQRPTQRTPIRHFYLAGDYTAGDYPATLESAVRSGVKCADLLLTEAKHN